MSEHASNRMMERGLSPNDVENALAFGREVHTRGVTIYVIGRKEVNQANALSVNIAQSEGVHVVCGRDGSIITTYRNSNLRGLRPQHRTRSDRYLRGRFDLQTQITAYDVRAT